MMYPVAVPFDRIDEEQIQKPQRWDPADLGRFMVFRSDQPIFDILTFCLMWWVFRRCPETQTLFPKIRLVCGGITITKR